MNIRREIERECSRIGQDALLGPEARSAPWPRPQGSRRDTAPARHSAPLRRRQRGPPAISTTGDVTNGSLEPALEGGRARLPDACPTRAPAHLRQGVHRGRDCDVRDCPHGRNERPANRENLRPPPPRCDRAWTGALEAFDARAARAVRATIGQRRLATQQVPDTEKPRMRGFLAIGAPRFELGTSSPQTSALTRLRHAPWARVSRSRLTVSPQKSRSITFYAV